MVEADNNNATEEVFDQTLPDLYSGGSRHWGWIAQFGISIAIIFMGMSGVTSSLVLLC